MWHELAANPKAVDSIFSEPPGLQDVVLAMIKLGSDGPNMRMIVAMTSFPDKPPKRWSAYGQDYNSITITIDLHFLKFLSISGWSSENTVSITVERISEDLISFMAKGDNCEIHAQCGSFWIQKIQPYVRAE